MHWLDRITVEVAPRWTLKRQRARMAVDLLQRHYDAAAGGRRTEGWRKATTDANATTSQNPRLRDVARDLVRNNPYARAALDTIVNHTVGTGIVAQVSRSARAAARTEATDRWSQWADTTACDADGRLDFAGLQKQVIRTVAEAGECLVRRRWRRPEDGLPIPMQLQILEPDYLDTTKEGLINGGAGGRIVQGVEFDGIGRRRNYWLFREHPGSTMTGAILGGGISNSMPIPADDVLHVFRSERPGQVRGVSWFAPVTVRLHEFDDYEDATLLKQKIAACLAVITTDVDGLGTPIGDTRAADPTIDLLQPGMIINAAPGKNIEVVEPPAVNDYSAFSTTVLRAIASGLGLTYEDITGDYQGMPFSAARMSRLRHWASVDDWRWRLIIPQFCDPVWRWAMQAAAIISTAAQPPGAEWTCPPAPMIDPEAEGNALQRLVRIGALSWPEMMRERGYDPEAVLDEVEEWNKSIDERGLKFDCDPRYLSQAGQAQAATGASSTTAPTSTPNGSSPNGNGNKPVAAGSNGRAHH